MVQSFHSEFEDLLRGPIQVDLKGTHRLDACVFEEVVIGEPVIGEVASSYPNLMGGFGWTLVIHPVGDISPYPDPSGVRASKKKLDGESRRNPHSGRK